MNTSMDIHRVASVTTQAKCLNGEWCRRIVIRGTDGSELALNLYTDGRARLLDLPDEHVRVEEIAPKVERSPTPFAADAGASK